MQARISVLALLLVVVSPAAAALGLGPATVHTVLGQRLSVRIPLLRSRGERGAVNVALAPAAAFKRASVPYPAYAGELRFAVKGGPGGGWIRVTSTRPMTDPVVEFVVRVAAGGATLERAYGLLLNLPPAR